MTGFLAAAQFLTRVPIRLQTSPSPRRTIPWFPAVGAIIGFVVGGVTVGLMEVVPPGVAAAVAVVVGIMVTGAFHEDGLADTADAMGGNTPERRREILKDSRHGSYGVAAMCSTIVVRVVCVASLGPAAAFAGLVAAHALGRGAAVGVMGLARPMPESDLGANYTRAATPAGAVLGVVSALAIAGLATGWWAIPLALVVVVGVAIVSGIASQAFGGVGGDILGAVEQVGECLVLVVVTGLAAHHTLWWA